MCRDGNAAPFTPSSVVATTVGTMSLRFTDANHATLNYSYNGAAVTKSITRQSFSTAPTCVWSAFDRSFSNNFQDLWWNPSESGWGVNVAHQGDILFATLFTYDENGNVLTPKSTVEAIRAVYVPEIHPSAVALA